MHRFSDKLGQEGENLLRYSVMQYHGIETLRLGVSGLFLLDLVNRYASEAERFVHIFNLTQKLEVITIN